MKMTERAVFTCTIDRETWRMTGVMFGLLLFFAGFSWLINFGLGVRGLWWVTVLIAAVVAGAPICIYGSLPRRIVVTPEAFALKCPFHTKIIPREAGIEVRRVRDYDTQNLGRTWGSDGLFGKWGRFTSKLYPRMHFYTKRGPKDWILLKTAGREIYILSPDDSEGFLKCVNTAG